MTFDSSSAHREAVILVDKPSGWTSHDVVAHYRKKLGIKKIGHTGTLDPLATGLLILLVGQATRRQAEFAKLDKRYLVTALLGFVSDTYDIEGQISQTAKVPIQPSRLSKSLPQVEEALSRFRGRITQRVPPFSAVKVGGKKLYQLARRGKLGPENLPIRKVEIKQLELLSLSSPNLDRFSFPTPSNLRSKLPHPISDEVRDLADSLVTLTLSVHCSSGTYIRSLVHDLGQVLKCGALVSSLRRTRVGDYRVKDAEQIS